MYNVNKNNTELNTQATSKYYGQWETDKIIESYFKNINTHSAYKKFRSFRKLMRDKNNFSNISLLINNLDSYAEDDRYVKIISAIIQSNNLNQFNIFSYSTSRS